MGCPRMYFARQSKVYKYISIKIIFEFIIFILFQPISPKLFEPDPYVYIYIYEITREDLPYNILKNKANRKRSLFYAQLPLFYIRHSPFKYTRYFSVTSENPISMF